MLLKVGLGNQLDLMETLLIFHMLDGFGFYLVGYLLRPPNSCPSVEISNYTN